MPDSVPNYDWSRVLGETLDETIQNSGVLGFAAPQLPPSGVEAMINSIRTIVAVELMKVAHGYKSTSALLAPNNVSYKIEGRAEKIRDAEMSWHVSVDYDTELGDDRETYPVESYDRGQQDASIIRQSITAPKSVTVWFGAKTHE